MRFTKRDITPPSDGIKEFTFQCDLRNHFDKNSNHDVSQLLHDRNVFTDKDSPDVESACVWVYFETEQDALAFLRRLNAQPEIKNWVKPTKQRFILLKEKEFKALQKYIATLSQKHRKAIKALDIHIYGIQEHYTNS